jgi:4-amino-4-deoxy-L-arabinose transferase-like glycosyltransferase
LSIKKLKYFLLKNKLGIVVLASLFLLGLFLRLYLIDKNLFFGPEQGRDMLVVRDIVLLHKWVLIGPRTAIDGIFHGPLYYYLATIPFVIGKGSPLTIEYFFIFLNCLAVFPFYFLVKELFEKKTALISTVLFVFSFGAIVMSRWLSHPPLVIPLSCCFFLFLTRFIKGKNNYLLPASIFFGLVSQTEFTDFLIFSFIALFSVVIFWKRFFVQKIAYLLGCGVALLLITFVNFLLFDLRHKFLITNSFLGLLTKQTGFYSTYWNSFLSSINKFINISSDSITPSIPLLTAILVLLGLIVLIKNINKNKITTKLLLIWLFSPLLGFVVLRYNPLYHYFTASIIPVIILIAFLISRLFLFNRIFAAFAIFLLVLLNLYATFTYLPDNRNVFFQSTQPDLKYLDQVATVREIYKESGGKDFYFQTYTIPYWLQEGWEYLFWYYGTNFYKYVPENKNPKLLFVIIQSDRGNLLYQNNWLKNTVAKWGIKKSEFRFGTLRTEKLVLDRLF